MRLTKGLYSGKRRREVRFNKFNTSSRKLNFSVRILNLFFTSQENLMEELSAKFNFLSMKIEYGVL